jgi:hypothetical protein
LFDNAGLRNVPACVVHPAVDAATRERLLSVFKPHVAFQRALTHTEHNEDAAARNVHWSLIATRVVMNRHFPKTAGWPCVYVAAPLSHYRVVAHHVQPECMPDDARRHQDIARLDAVVQVDMVLPGGAMDGQRVVTWCTHKLQDCDCAARLHPDGYVVVMQDVLGHLSHEDFNAATARPTCRYVVASERIGERGYPGVAHSDDGATVTFTGTDQGGYVHVSYEGIETGGLVMIGDVYYNVDRAFTIRDRAIFVFARVPPHMATNRTVAIAGKPVERVVSTVGVGRDVATWRMLGAQHQVCFAGRVVTTTRAAIMAAHSIAMPADAASARTFGIPTFKRQLETLGVTVTTADLHTLYAYGIAHTARDAMRASDLTQSLLGIPTLSDHYAAVRPAAYVDYAANEFKHRLYRFFPSNEDVLAGRRPMGFAVAGATLGFGFLVAAAIMRRPILGVAAVCTIAPVAGDVVVAVKEARALMDSRTVHIIAGCAAAVVGLWLLRLDAVRAPVGALRLSPIDPPGLPGFAQLIARVFVGATFLYPLIGAPVLEEALKRGHRIFVDSADVRPRIPWWIGGPGFAVFEAVSPGQIAIFPMRLAFHTLFAYCGDKGGYWAAVAAHAAWNATAIIGATHGHLTMNEKPNAGWNFAALETIVPRREYFDTIVEEVVKQSEAAVQAATATPAATLRALAGVALCVAAGYCLWRVFRRAPALPAPPAATPVILEGYGDNNVATYGGRPVTRETPLPFYSGVPVRARCPQRDNGFVPGLGRPVLRWAEASYDGCKESTGVYLYSLVASRAGVFLPNMCQACCHSMRTAMARQTSPAECDDGEAAATLDLYLTTARGQTERRFFEADCSKGYDERMHSFRDFIAHFPASLRAKYMQGMAQYTAYGFRARDAVFEGMVKKEKACYATPAEYLTGPERKLRGMAKPNALQRMISQPSPVVCSVFGFASYYVLHSALVAARDGFFCRTDDLPYGVSFIGTTAIVVPLPVQNLVIDGADERLEEHARAPYAVFETAFGRHEMTSPWAAASPSGSLVEATADYYSCVCRAQQQQRLLHKCFAEEVVLVRITGDCKYYDSSVRQAYTGLRFAQLGWAGLLSSRQIEAAVGRENFDDMTRVAPLIGELNQRRRAPFIDETFPVAEMAVALYWAPRLIYDERGVRVFDLKLRGTIMSGLPTTSSDGTTGSRVAAGSGGQRIAEALDLRPAEAAYYEALNMPFTRGDDNNLVCAVPRSLVPHVAALYNGAFAKFGLKNDAVAEVLDDNPDGMPSMLPLCSHFLMPCQGLPDAPYDVCFCQRPSRVFYKFLAAPASVPKELHRAYFKANARALRTDAGHCTPIRWFADAILRNLSSVADVSHPTFHDRDAAYRWHSDRDMSVYADDARAWAYLTQYYCQRGVDSALFSRESILSLEAFFRVWLWGEWLDHPLILAFCEAEL